MKLRITEILLLFVCVIFLVSCTNYSSETNPREELPTPTLITNADRSIEPFEMHIGQNFNTFNLRQIWYDEDGAPEQATLISGNGTSICPVSPIVRGTVLVVGDGLDGILYLFIVDEEHRHYIPVFDTEKPEPYIFEIRDFRTALGSEQAQSLVLFDLFDFNERKAYIRIVRTDIFASPYDFDIIEGRFIWLEDLIIHWRLS